MERAGDKSEKRSDVTDVILGVLLIVLSVLTSGLAARHGASRPRHRPGGSPLPSGDGVMDHSAEYKSELRTYIAGFVLAVLLTVPPFSFVAWHGASRSTILWIIAGTAVAQIAVHFRFFLHIDLSKSKRDDLQLILFSLLIVVLMAGGTIWILGNLRDRMM